MEIVERQEWTPGQKLYISVNPIWDTYYDEAPDLDEECIWQTVASILEPREVLVLELRFGRRLGYSLTLRAVGSVLKREQDKGIGVTGERARGIEAKALRKLRHPARFVLLQEATSPDTREKSEKILEVGKNSLREREFPI